MEAVQISETLVTHTSLHSVTIHTAVRTSNHTRLSLDSMPYVYVFNCTYINIGPKLWLNLNYTNQVNYSQVYNQARAPPWNLFWNSYVKHGQQMGVNPSLKYVFRSMLPCKLSKMIWYESQTAQALVAFLQSHVSLSGGCTSLYKYAYFALYHSILH